MGKSTRQVLTPGSWSRFCHCVNLGEFVIRSRPQVSPFTISNRLTLKSPNSSQNSLIFKLNWAYHAKLSNVYKCREKNIYFKFNPLKNYSNQRFLRFHICQGVETEEYSGGRELNYLLSYLVTTFLILLLNLQDCR